MKQLGNLAIICAQRQSVLLQIQGGMASVTVGAGPERHVLSARWDNDTEIEQIIHELNFGKYRADAGVSPSKNADFGCADTLWDILLKHKDHNVSIVTYGDPDAPADVCLECVDCGEVVIDAELYTLTAITSSVPSTIDIRPAPEVTRAERSYQ